MADPIHPEVRQQMNHVARLLDESFNEKGKPKKYGFALLVFDFTRPGIDREFLSWISNAERADMLVALKEYIARMEGRAPDTEGHA